jgi:hypothetical protein
MSRPAYVTSVLVLPPLAAVLRARAPGAALRGLCVRRILVGTWGRSGKELFPLSPPFDQEAVKERRKSALLATFPESLIDENLHIHATVQGAPLCVGVLGGGMSGTVARRGNDPPHGNISLLE